MRILLVEDDPMVGAAIRKGLQQDGHTLDWVRDGVAAAAALATDTHDLMLLDLGLPGKPGLDVLAELRRAGNALPVIICTARDAVAERVRAVMPDLKSQMPSDLEVFIPYDASVFIEESIKEVFTTLAEAVLIVLLVIYLSLGSLRAALIPAVAVPLSIVGAAFLMLLLGYSVNLLTLLSMVLAIGLVVDDAIVVVENVHRHIAEGKTPLLCVTGTYKVASGNLSLPGVIVPVTK